jgi:hypothetical protein
MILAFFVHDALTPAIMTAIWFSLALVPVTVDVVIVAMEKLGREKCLALFTLLAWTADMVGRTRRLWAVQGVICRLISSRLYA